MRTKKLLAGMVVLCVVPLVMVYGQRTPGSFSVGGFGGVGLPMGPEAFKYFWKMGYGFGGAFKYNITEMTSFAASFTHQSFKSDDDAMMDFMVEMEAGPPPPGMEVEFSEGGMTMSIISANLIQYFTPPSASLGLYVTAGGGYYMPKIDDYIMKITWEGDSDENPLWEEEDWDLNNGFGLNGGAGLELVLGGGSVCFFAEGKYHYTLIDLKMKDVDIEEETGKKTGNISFITIMGGIRFSP